MQEFPINWWAVLVAAIVKMVIVGAVVFAIWVRPTVDDAHQLHRS
jgi:hypothetical protein